VPSTTRDAMDERVRQRSPRGRGRDSRGARHPAGVTLPELLVAMTIAGILVTIGVPSFRHVTTQNRMAGEANSLLGDLQFARGEAVKEGRPVTVCSSSDGATCSASTSWDGGWIVFADSNGSQAVDPGEPILRAQAAFTGGDTFQADNATRAVTFNRQGFALGLPGTVTVALHDSSGTTAWSRCVAISIVGRLEVEKSGTGACL
jgi:type IV fimbrial biogenesis protein FimT